MKTDPSHSDRRNVLEQALRDRQFTPYYQPIHRARDGALVAVEALARWRTGGGVVGPADFLTDIEALDLHHHLAARMLMASLRDLKLMHDDGLVGRDVRVHVNVSPHQLDSFDRIDEVEYCARQHGFPVDVLAVELTETGVLADRLLARSMLAECRERGVPVVLDDLGAGHSSLALLQTMPFDGVKIDRSFVHGVADDRAARAVVGGLVRIAHDLGATVTAEGVERPDDHNVLCELGVDQLQGYLYARPVPVDELRRMLAEGALPHNPPPTQRDVSTTIGRAADQLERLAVGLELLMPRVRDARTTFADLSPELARRIGFAGSHEQLGLLADESVGFRRVDRARRRILDALADDWDDVPGWLDGAAPSTH